MSSPDPYKVLEVDPAASRAVIESAYKRLARRYHPDVSIEPNAVARMVQINQAWEMLRDPERRASVDRALARSAGTSARAVAADGRTTARGRTNAPAGAQAGVEDDATWQFPSTHDPSAGTFGPRGEHGSPNWSSGRSTEGHGYDSRTTGAGAAGPPPGSPSGSIVSFGRFQGWTLGEIARTDLEYLEWLDRMPIGRAYQAEIDRLLREHGRRVTATTGEGRGRGLFRRR